jgi:hypothetical protein
VEIPEWLYQRVRTAAERQGRTVTDVVTEAVSQWLFGTASDAQGNYRSDASISDKT